MNCIMFNLHYNFIYRINEIFQENKYHQIFKPKLKLKLLLFINNNYYIMYRIAYIIIFVRQNYRFVFDE